MSKSRGMLRCWLAGTALWVAAVGGAGYVDLRDAHPFSGLYSYSTSKEEFIAQPYDASDGTIEEGVQRGIMARTSFPDGTTLVAPQDQGDAKLQEITQRFWEERWQRRAEALSPWAMWALTPPVLALVLGGLIFRTSRGSRPVSAAPHAAEAAAREPVAPTMKPPLAPSLGPVTPPVTAPRAEAKQAPPKPDDALLKGATLESAPPERAASENPKTDGPKAPIPKAESPKAESRVPDAPPAAAGSPNATPAPFIQTLGPDVKRAIAQRRAARASSRFDLTRARKSAKTD